MRDLLVSIIRRRAGRDGASPPRPDDGYEQVKVDSNQDIIIDGVPMGTANVDANRGSGNPLKFVLWIVILLILATAASGYWNTLPGQIQGFWNELRRPDATMPRLPDTGIVDPRLDDTAPTGSEPTAPRSKKNTY